MSMKHMLNMFTNLSLNLTRLERETKARFEDMEKNLPTEHKNISLNPDRVDVMVDIETLGTESDSFIFQIAATVFDIETGDITNKFDKVVDLDKPTHGMIHADTLKWWATNHSELFQELIKRGDISSQELAQEFHEWLSDLSPDMSNVYLWGNGILFDNNKIQTFFNGMNLKYPIHFRNDRDVRTIFELAQIKTGKTSKEMYEEHYDKSLAAHDAINDCINQSNLVAACYQILMENGGIN